MIIRHSLLFSRFFCLVTSVSPSSSPPTPPSPPLPLTTTTPATLQQTKKDFLSPELSEYINTFSIRKHPTLENILNYNLNQIGASEKRQMATTTEVGQLLGLLVKMMNAKRALEIGVFTGYSSTAIALALPPDGKLICCEKDPKVLQISTRFWEEAKVLDKIQVMIGPARSSLDQLLHVPENLGSFDFVFIDADKANYDSYYESALKLVRKRGLIVIDNVLWKGRVVFHHSLADNNQQKNEIMKESREDKKAEIMHKLNVKLLADERVDISMLPLSDGLTLALKR